MNELFKGITPERHWQSIVVNAESLIAEVLPAVSAERGQHIEQVMVIIDLKGFRFVAPLTRRFLRSLVNFT